MLNLPQITFIFLKVLEESLHVVSLSSHIDQDVVLFPLTLLLVSIYELSGSFAIETLGFLNVVLLIDIALLGRCESRSQEIQHIFFNFNFIKLL